MKDNQKESATMAVALINLGTPEQPTTKAIRSYLKQFLSDPRVIDIPSWAWWFILNGFILPIRPRKIVHSYGAIWWPEGSPLRVISDRQTQGLKQVLYEKYGNKLAVVSAMNYGEPSIPKVFSHLKKLKKLLILPLYPQYSFSTVGATFDSIAKYFNTQAYVPELKFLNGYHCHPQYISAIANSIETHWQQNGKAKRLIFSFHGIPKRYYEKGDPYPEQCHESAKLVAEQLNLTSAQWMVTFQSRFGPAEWIKPYTMETLQSLPSQNIDSIDIISPGFAADCLETLEELAIMNRDVFLQAGGKQFNYIPALNDHPDHIELLMQLVEENL